MSKKNMYSPEFKTKVVLEMLAGQKTLNELAAKHKVAPATLTDWNKQFQEHAVDVFRKDPSDADKQLDEKEEEISVLQQKVGQLTIERDWLKKKSDEVFGLNGAHRTRFPRK